MRIGMDAVQAVKSLHIPLEFIERSCYVHDARSCFGGDIEQHPVI